MYAFTAFVLVSLITAAAVLVPLYRPSWLEKTLEWLQDATLRRADRVVLDTGGRRRKELVRCLRIWFFVVAGLFALFGLLDGSMIRNHPDSIGSVLGYGVLAMGSSSILLLSLMAFTWFLPGVKLYLNMNRCGFRELSFHSPQDLYKDFHAGLASRLGDSSGLSVLDVTGAELIGKGPGPDGGPLYDLLAGAPHVPVTLLLLKPHADEVDPDRRHATVFQTVLSEMEISAATYEKRFRATLRAVEELNTHRAPEARIAVRLYNEKPTMRAIIFDDSMLASPWLPREEKGWLAVYDLKQVPSAPSFYETFRHSVSRLSKQSVLCRWSQARLKTTA